MKIDVGFGRRSDPKRYDRLWRRIYNKQSANIKRKLVDYKYMDKKAGHTVCDYTYRELLHILSTNKCYYCESTERLSLDRIDNNKGHTKDNTVVACTMCNTVRMNIFTMKEIGPFIRKIVDQRRSINNI